jgi:hypothetical protein
LRKKVDDWEKKLLKEKEEIRIQKLEMKRKLKIN